MLRHSRALLLCDEVYEHIVFDGARHESVARHPELAERAFVISSFGKTLHTTGWKIGYAMAPAAMTREFRKVHQFMVFAVNTPAQHGIAAYIADARPYVELPAFYQRKRDAFRAGLASTRFELLPCEGTYFQCVRYDAISDQPENAFARWLTSDIGVAAIPVSAFCRTQASTRVVRFCFAKKDETLANALERLARRLAPAAGRLTAHRLGLACALPRARRLRVHRKKCRNSRVARETNVDVLPIGRGRSAVSTDSHGPYDRGRNATHDGARILEVRA